MREFYALGLHDVTVSTNAPLSLAGVSRAPLWRIRGMLCLRPVLLGGVARPVKVRTALVIASTLVLGACSSMHMPHVWPFYKKQKPAPEAVHELELLNSDGTPASFPQYWKRNTLVIDLSGISGSGGLAARLPAETTWPVRVAVRVQPGSVQQIEVQGEERNVMAVAAEGTLPIDLEFATSVIRPSTQAVYVNWGPMPQFAEVVIAPEAGFVSPMVVPEHPVATPHPAEEPTPSASEIIAPEGAAPPPKN